MSFSFTRKPNGIVMSLNVETYEGIIRLDGRKYKFRAKQFLPSRPRLPLPGEVVELTLANDKLVSFKPQV